ncbi:caspase family protein [Actinocrispum sp. NPDC049592]|uniref:caspase, EACC1-associated type n=1 Tax=Actinocrispum sp. NPDC049592 TaxID=3154835 RepID=UPI00341B325B
MGTPFSDPRAALVLATGLYTDTRLARLRAPAQDATGMREVLADPHIGGFQVTTVTDRPEHEVRRSVHAFLLARNPADLVVLYLSCHGLLDTRGQLYFAAADTDRDQLASTAMSAEWLLERLDECRARRQVVILDCCFSGAFSRNAKGDTDIDLDRRLAGGRGRVILTASRATEYSFEGEALHEGGSVFTEALVDGLRTGKADREGKGHITVEDAYQYAAARTENQTPQRWLYGGEGEIVLARTPPVGEPGTPSISRVRAALAELGQLGPDDLTRLRAIVEKLSERGPTAASTHSRRADGTTAAARSGILLVYLLVDVSVSDEQRVRELDDLVNDLRAQVLKYSPSVRCGVIAFAGEAHLAASALDVTAPRFSHHPVSSRRSYTAAFTLLDKQSIVDIAALSARGQFVARMLIAVIANGDPTDGPPGWQRTYAKLIRKSPVEITVLCVAAGPDPDSDFIRDLVEHPGISKSSQAVKTELGPDLRAFIASFIANRS